MRPKLGIHATIATVDASEEHAAEVVAPAGQFRIYLGAAAGVGKTYAMLSEGQRRRGRGADVVVAFVESHSRPLTERLLEGLENNSAHGDRLSRQPASRSWTSPPSWPDSRRSLSSTSLPTPMCPAQARTPNAGKTCLTCSPPASASLAPSIFSTWKASQTKSSTSPASGYASGFLTQSCAGPTRSS